MLEQLKRLLGEHEFLRPSMLRSDPASPSPSTCAKHFTSLDAAYQQVFRLALQQVRDEVESLLQLLASGLKKATVCPV